MSSHSKVIWSEGLFLQPHHLQQQERYFESLVLQQPNLTGLAHWGILEYEIDKPLLALGKFALLSCKGVLPDGSYFDMLSQGCLPSPIDIPLKTVNICVFLALPLKRSGSPEIALADEDKHACRFEAKSLDVSDNVSGMNDKVEIQVGKYTLRFLLESQELGGFSCLALAKIKEVLPNKQVHLDDEFIPPCLDVHAVRKLDNFSKELLSLLYQRGESIAVNQRESGYGDASEILEFVLLGILNRSEAILRCLTAKKPFHPESFYLYIVALLAELTTFNRKSPRLKTIPLYKHHDLQHAFDPLIGSLRDSLGIIIERNILELPLEKRQYGMWVSTIEERALLQHATFIIGIYAAILPEELHERFNASVKIASVDTIQSLITHVLPGIDCHLLPTAPREIPLTSGFLYFALNKRHPQWADLASASAIAIHIGTEFPELKLQFWAIREKEDA